MFENIPYERPLIIGAGGGNDIVSATLILSELAKQGKSPDLAGMCSPGAWHSYNGKEERSVNAVEKGATRYRSSKITADITFIDGLVPELLQQEGIDSRVYNFSCRFGTNKLIEGLSDLIQRNNYDGIVAVDIGGDILARGKKDPTILSPLMDFTLLYTLGQINTPSTLLVYGLQTDGELRPKGCSEILEELEKSGTLKDTITLNDSDQAVSTLKRIYDKIKDVRHGHTTHMTLKTLLEREDIQTEYRGRIRVVDKKWNQPFPIILESKYFGKVFTLDPKGLEKTRDLAFSHEDALDLLLKTKKIVDTKTEMDMLYTKVGDSYLWLSLLAPQVTGPLRQEILRHGFESLNQYADVAIVWEKDEEVILKGMNKKRVDNFVVAGEQKNVEEVVERIEEILERRK